MEFVTMSVITDLGKSAVADRGLDFVQAAPAELPRLPASFVAATLSFAVFKEVKTVSTRNGLHIADRIIIYLRALGKFLGK